MDGGPFVGWLFDTRQTSSTYEGEPGHCYGFYVVAVDHVGNEEAHPASAQAITCVEAAGAAPAGFGSSPPDRTKGSVQRPANAPTWSADSVTAARLLAARNGSLLPQSHGDDDPFLASMPWSAQEVGESLAGEPLAGTHERSTSRRQRSRMLDKPRWFGQPFDEEAQFVDEVFASLATDS